MTPKSNWKKSSKPARFSLTAVLFPAFALAWMAGCSSGGGAATDNTGAAGASGMSGAAGTSGMSGGGGKGGTGGAGGMGGTAVPTTAKPTTTTTPTTTPTGAAMPDASAPPTPTPTDATPPPTTPTTTPDAGATPTTATPTTPTTATPTTPTPTPTTPATPTTPTTATPTPTPTTDAGTKPTTATPTTATPTTATPTTPTPTPTTPATPTTPTTAGNQIKYVLVITMENKPASAIYNSAKAPYLNSVLAKYARSTNFADTLSDGIPSEPHYIWMEGGTNAFSDRTFTDDSDPSASNSTKSTAHLVTQMQAASPAIGWMGYMEGLNSSTGACPIQSSGFYAAKHDPFVFFQDVAGSPPSKTNAYCAAHHRAYTKADFGALMAQKAIAPYSLITPDVCNDMHGDSGCPSTDPITVGDQWLQANLPPMIDFVNANNGVILIVWDEPEGGSPLMPFVAIGPHVKPAYASSVKLTHGSLTKSIEEIFNLPILPTVAGETDLKDLFQPGFFP